MDVSSSTGVDVQSIMNSKLQQSAGNVSAGVAKKAMDAEKGMGNQVVDMIRKVGATIDVTA